MENYIQKSNGPCVILAGAGTGKTRSIVEKMKYLIQNKIYDPKKIVCLTFSNEAVNTIRERVSPIIREGKEPVIMTFHAYCAELLRKNGNKIDLKENFKIILPDDGKVLLHKYFKIHPLLCNRYISEISNSKDLGITIEEKENKVKKTYENLEELENELNEVKFQVSTFHIKKIKNEKSEEIKKRKEELEEEVKQRKFIQAWKSYEKIKYLKNGLDYADLNIKALELLEKFPETTEDCEYLIIDEFQDTNRLQCELIKNLARHRNFTIVGDLNQSIYSFRGAYKENFNYIRKEMSVSKEDTFKLDKSYRSTNKILEIAHKLIKNNYKNPEDCFEVKSAYNENGENIKCFELKNGNEETRKIIEIIKSEIGRQTPFEEICVIFRTHQQANSLKKELEIEEIPYVNINRESLIKTDIIKKIRAYLTLINKYKNSEKGGNRALWEIMHESSENQQEEISFGRTLSKFEEKECLIKEIIHEEVKEFSEKIKLKINNLGKIIKSVAEYHKTSEILKKLYESLDLQNENPEKVVSLERFKTFSKEFEESESDDLGIFIHHLETLDALNVSVENPSVSKRGIKIMTNHATKGLEYQAVIIGSLTDGKFPLNYKENSIISEKEIGDESHTDEERRLFYVGCTRAKKRLYFTYAQEYGKRKHEPSRFLKEIEYNENNNIDFVKDESEKYQKREQKIEIKSAEEIEIENLSFSHSALQKFDECQKKYEYKYIYNMPDPTPQSWEAITTGNFIHKILEEVVKQNLKNIEEVEECAKKINLEEFKDSNLEEVKPLLKIFIERNKEKYNENSLVEEWLTVYLEGIKFIGKADRIDISDNGEVTIIDYKTGKSDIKPKYRNWQLGLYALASKKLGTPKTLILEMLQKDHPLEFNIDSKGIAKEVHSTRTQFSLQEVKEELVETARAIIQARKTGFKPCPIEKNCDFCEEWADIKKSNLPK